MKAGLLKKPAESEYPESFLVARLLGKKSTLFRNWELLIASSDPVDKMSTSPFHPYLKQYDIRGIWKYLTHEYLWVYTRMNNNLRTVFEPYFIYQEMGSLVKSLRYLYSRNEVEAVRQQLHNSLLQHDLQGVLTGGKIFSDMLNDLESFLCSRSDIFHGLLDQYERYGLHALEMSLREKWLSFALLQCHYNPIKLFIQYMIDFHNCITLAKSIRWKMAKQPLFIKGGNIGPEKLKRIHARNNLDAVVSSFSITSADEPISSVTGLETVLLNSITKQLRRWSYQRTVAGDILFYLWEQFRYTRNIGMILNTVQLDDEAVSRSVIS